MVEKTQRKGRAAQLGVRVIFGLVAAMPAVLRRSRASRSINTAFVERPHGTDRHRNARKERRTHGFSKDWRFHGAVTYFME